MEEKQYYIYILASRKHGTLYTGVTSNLIKRVYEHKNELADGFTKQYKIHHLVHYEIYNDILQAIAREKNIKKWKREWKVRLIEAENPDWTDLYNSLL